MGEQTTKPRTWFRIENKGDESATVYLYDEIGSWGVTASEFVKDLQELESEKITVRISSPGGDYFDGMAIYNALREHPSEVTVHIDGLAASAASFVAMAGDVIRATNNAELMIHEAHSMGYGNGGDLRKQADLLDRFSATIAGIYADRAGGTTEAWRGRMQAETWFSADEAKRAGLVDEVVSGRKARNSWDPKILAVYNYSSRDKAPDPFAEVENVAPVEPDPPPTPEPGPTDPPDEAGFLMPDIRGPIQALSEIPWDAELFKAAVHLVANDSPAPDPSPVSEPEPPEPDFTISLPDLRRNLREARL